MRGFATATLLLAATVDASNAKGEAFLQENKLQEGVITLPSGLQYKVIQAAANMSSPTPSASTPCECHYEGRTIDGTVFDSSRKRGKPTTFAPNQVIKGWTEALQLMRAGDHWELYVPSELAYGSRGAGGRIGPDEVLIFDLEIISIAEGGDGLWAKLAIFTQPLTAPIFGPFAPWHLVLFLVMAYRRLGGGSGGGRKVSASHILVKEEGKCEVLLTELAGKDAAELGPAFAKLAQKHSTCPSGKNGGSLGEFGPGQMVPAFDKVCWSAPVGKVQGPIQTGFGFHLILVTSRTDPAADDSKAD